MTHERHCYKCNSRKTEAGGALHRDTRGRQRFVCADCVPFIVNRARAIAAPRAAR